MSYGYPSGSNTFVPSTSFDASTAIMMGYSRNPAKFAVNRYAQRFMTRLREVYVGQWYSQQGGRIKTGSSTIDPGNEFAWADGQDRPSGVDNLEAFEFVLYGTKRYSYGFTLGNLAIEQASWNLLAAQSGVVAQQAMTVRTQHVLSALQAQVTAGAINTATATSLSGSGKFNAGTPSQPNAKIGLYAAATTINKTTMGIVDIKDLCLVMNPNTAQKIGASQEVTDNMKFVGGLNYVLDGAPVTMSNWGIPDRFYGFETIVETTTINTNAKKTASTDIGSYIVPDGTIYMISKVGGLEGIEGSGSFSTVQLYMKTDLEVQTLAEPWHKRVSGAVETDYVAVITPQGASAAYQITAAI